MSIQFLLDICDMPVSLAEDSYNDLFFSCQNKVMIFYCVLISNDQIFQNHENLPAIILYLPSLYVI